MKYFYIYKTINLVDSKIYIGQRSSIKSPEKDVEYLGSGVYFSRALKKYGKENFIKEILEVCTSLEETNTREIIYIDLYDSRNPKIGYNIHKGGGNLGNILTYHPNRNDIIKRMSITRTGKKQSHEWVKGRMDSRRENDKTRIKKPISEETREKLRNRPKRNKTKEEIRKQKETRGKFNQSEETKEKIRLSTIINNSKISIEEKERRTKKAKQTKIENGTYRKPLNQETKDKIGKSNLGKTRTKEQIENNRQMNKGRLPWNTGQNHSEKTKDRIRKTLAETRRLKKLNLILNILKSLL